MKKLSKLLIWSTIITGVFISIIYYRYFLFSPEFNQPVDMVISDISKKVNIEIPSYKIPADVVSVDNAAFSRDVSETPVAISEEKHAQQEGSADEIDVADAEHEAIEHEATELQMPELLRAEVSDSETKDSRGSDSQLSITDIVGAVKDTVNEALDVFREESKQQSVQLAVNSASTLSSDELLFKARLAYWNRDLKSAENTYIKLTEMVDDPNVYGELGNLYYMQSRWKKAGDAYYRAALKLKDIKQIDRAYHLLRIIRGLDTDTANRLQIELQHSS